MNLPLKTSIAAFTCLTVLLFGLCAGHAGSLIRDGDPVRVDYTCRLASGEIVDTTDSNVAADSTLKKSNVFVPRETFGAVAMTAGGDRRCDTSATAAGIMLPHKAFESEIAARLSAVLVGKPLGATVQVQLTSTVQTDLPDNERYIRLGRQTQLPKTLKMTRARFEQQFAVPARSGETLDIYPELEGRVADVSGDEVVIRFEPRRAEPRQGEYGEVAVHDKGDHYVIETSIREGDLVRVGPVVGQITDAKGATFTIDFGHPFGGQRLFCDVMAERLSTGSLTAGMSDGSCAQNDQTVRGGAAASATVDPAAAGSIPTQNTAALEEDPNRIQPGDLIEIDYTAVTEDGRVVATTVESVASDGSLRTIEGFVEPDTFAPILLVADESGSVFGLSEIVVGMQTGQQKRIVLPPSQAFGQVDPRMLGQYPKIRHVPKTMSIDAKDYIQRYGGFPVQGNVLVYNAYLNGRVDKIENKTALLSLTPRGDKFTETYGSVSVREDGDQITVELTPKLGAEFVLENRRGKIVADDGKTFTVDYNHPLAGQAVVLDIDIVSLTKASKFNSASIQWTEDYENGLDTAQKQNKPAVLVLYADWCSYSKKLLEEALPDPRIGLLKDEFVWIKIDSSKYREYKELYEQTSFPLTLVMDADGQVLKRIKGYKPAGIFRQELKSVLNQNNRVAMQ